MILGKKTKIVCTMGPASESPAKLTELVNAGMNVMRLNFSHGSFDEHQKRVDAIREIMPKIKRPVAILQDLCGPKIRIGAFKEGFIMLHSGDIFTLTTEKIEGTKEKVFINYPQLPQEVKPGGKIMLHDGTKQLEVIEVKGNEIVTKVIVGGRLSNHKGVNVPGANLSIHSLTEKDKKDLEFGIKNKVDFIALSFVRRSSDIRELREILVKEKCNAQIIAKIETPEALADIDGIIEAADGIMIARGDLAIEIPAEDVPFFQKQIITKCHNLGKPAITATQMLLSMVTSPVPTRAEVSDVANAIYDGTDAIMLSEETSIGEYPVEAVKIMSLVANRIEKEVYTRDTITEFAKSHGITDIVSESAVRTAHNIGAKFIVALTRSGRTARMLARYRPTEHILALSDDPANANKLMLAFGVYPIVSPTFKTIDEILKLVRNITVESKLAKAGDKVVIVAGMPFGIAADTNFVLVETL